jgi:LDH2 family malate/lactate/ureidoglycolate dehydrogenase
MRTLILGLSLIGFSAQADVFCSATCAVGPYRSAIDYSVYASGETHEEALNKMFNQCKAKRKHSEDPIVFFTSASKRSSWDYSREMEFDIRKACTNEL